MEVAGGNPRTPTDTSNAPVPPRRHSKKKKPVTQDGYVTMTGSSPIVDNYATVNSMDIARILDDPPSDDETFCVLPTGHKKKEFPDGPHSVYVKYDPNSNTNDASDATLYVNNPNHALGSPTSVTGPTNLNDGVPDRVDEPKDSHNNSYQLYANVN